MYEDGELGMKSHLRKRIEDKTSLLVNDTDRNVYDLPDKDKLAIQRKRDLLNKRTAEIVKCKAHSQVIGHNQVENDSHVRYVVHYQYLVKHYDHLYIEEHCEQRKAIFRGKNLVEDVEVDVEITERENEFQRLDRDKEWDPSQRVNYNYDRMAVVKYAERWWNSYNPNYKKFENDCTNFISQCIHAGGAPMTGYPNRGSGWWMQNNNWSYSWTVANALRIFLSGSKSGLQAKEVNSASDLLAGDVICYDFEGDGKYNHTTVVVAKDRDGQPLVNAHTSNSRMRYWSYEDSTAYTPNIKYKYFTILGNG